MEKSENKKPNDTSKYNLRCNRNISEKMTKKDFIYDIPAPFQLAMRKDKCLPSPLKKSRNEFECLITASAVTAASQLKGSAIRSEVKLNKNPVGLLRLIPPQKFLPSSGIRTICKSSNRPLQLSLEKEIIVKEPERGETEKEIRRQIVLPIQLRRKIGSELKTPRYSVIPIIHEEQQLTISNREQIPAERKILGYQCNYCHDRLATFLSLSTHVKYHCQRHCNTCFRILEPQESMTQHVQKAHPVNGPDHVPIILN